MKKVFKYQIDDKKEQNVIMPDGSEIISVQDQDGKVCIWALVTPDNHPVPRIIQIFHTGEPIPSGYRKHLGTVQLNRGRLVLHVFERGRG